MVELDLHGSQEGEVVIIHDATLERTTNGQGEVKNQRLSALKKLDAGYWFIKDEPSSYPFRGQKIEIPTLEEFLVAFPGIRAILEIKQDHPSIVKKTVEAVRRLAREDSVLLATESDQIMTEIRREIAATGITVATGFCYGEVAAFINWLATGKSVAYFPEGQALQVPCEYGGMKLVSDQTLQGARDLGLEMFVWTVNDSREMRRLLRLGVDGIITDYPGRLRALLSQNTAAP